MKSTANLFISIFVLLFMTSAGFGQSPALSWVQSIGGSDSDFSQNAVTDSSGNIYFAGSFSDTVDLDPGAGTNITISNGNRDMFITKMDAGGNQLWVKTMGGQLHDAIAQIAVKPGGDFAITGFYQDSVDLDPGPGTNWLTNNGSQDMLLATYDLNGNLQWAHGFGMEDDERGQSVKFDHQGNLVITGYLRDTFDIDPGPGTTILTPVSTYDIFLAKFSPTGNLLWAHAFGGFISDLGYEVAIDLQDNIHLTGRIKNTFDIDPGPGVTTLTSNGNSDHLLAKFSPTGNLLWAFNTGSPDDDVASCVGVDKNGGVFMGGYFRGSVDFDPGPGTHIVTATDSIEGFLAKYDASGNLLFAFALGGPKIDASLSVTSDNYNNILVAGYFMDSMDCDPSAGTHMLYANGMQDMYMIKYSPSGDLIWARNFGGTLSDISGSIYVGPTGFLSKSLFINTLG